MDASSIIIVCTVVIFINAIGAMRTKKLDEFITVLMTREHKHNHGKMHCIKGTLWAQILLNMTLNTVSAIEKCLLSFDKTPHISNGIIFQLQVFLIIK